MPSETQQPPTPTGTTSAEGGRSVSVRSLRAGMRLSESIFDESGVMLLASGTEVSARFLRLLAHRQITTVVLQSTNTVSVSELVGNVLREVGPTQPFNKSGANLAPDELAEKATAGLKEHSSAGDGVQDIGRALCGGQSVAVKELDSVVHAFADMITLDTDLLGTIVAMHKSKAEYLFDHCVNTAALSMTLGSQLGLTEEQLTELGTGALVADVGMLQVPQNIRLSSKPFTPHERSELERHPCHTYDSLARMRGITTAARMIGYQIHERIDGKGYPRGRSGMFINKYAKIAAVADTFAALTRDRPHRPARLPYLAAKTILVECSQGKFDPEIVRTFLDTIGLFPIRSYVALDDGTKAIVLRTNPGLHTRPVIQRIDENGEPTGDAIDLAQDESATVTAAIDRTSINAPSS